MSNYYNSGLKNNRGKSIYLKIRGKGDKLEPNKDRHPRIVKRFCFFCGHDKAFTSRSEVGLGAFVFKCSKCKRYQK